MANFCAIIPQVTNKDGELVDSKLFTDLLSIVKDREQTKRIYVNTKSKSNDVQYVLQSVQILESEKGISIFNKGIKNNWSIDKILTELQIPKHQKKLILESGITDREELITNLLANYSNTIKINISKSEELDHDEYMDEQTGEFVEFDQSENSNYYANLTVPGGTNYTENEIATPGITPSIKGHASFSTDNGIGWFRSDDRKHTEEIELDEFENNEDENSIATVKSYPEIDGPKTRRILEVQSDLFQKGRDLDDLVTKQTKGSLDDFSTKMAKLNTELDNDEISVDEYKQRRKILEDNHKLSVEFQKLPDNQFLQLLNKDNNWVTFFIKSIIQDSSKKGYEKVLFPTGNTASKVEGHETIDDILNQNNNQIEQLSVLLDDKHIQASYDNELENAKNRLKQYDKIVDKTREEFDRIGDVYLNQQVTNSQYDYSRIRQNYWDRRYNPNSTETLTGDDYDGLVLNEYTVGRGEKITKISKEEALDLIAKNDAVARKYAEEEKIAAKKNLERVLTKEYKEEYLADKKRDLENSIQHLRDENKRIQEQGMDALAPIARFYEVTVTNILKKQGLEPKLIIDEYGNTWNEVTINQFDENGELTAESAIKGYNTVLNNRVLDPIQQFMHINKIPTQGRDFVKDKTKKILERLRKQFPNNNIRIQTRPDGGWQIAYDTINDRRSVLSTSGNTILAYDSLEEAINDFTKHSSIESLLLHYIDNAIDPITRETSKLIYDNMDKLKGVKLSIITGDQYRNERWAGRYFNYSRVVEINLSKWNKYGINIFEQTVIHELIHAFTTSALHNPKTDAEIKLANHVKKVYDSIKHSNLVNNYGLTNHYELVTEIMSNPDFVAELRSKKPTVLQKIINFIKNLLGIQKTDKTFYGIDSKIDNLILGISEFIPNSNPESVEGKLTVLEKRTGVVGEINQYTSERTRTKGRLPEVEKLLLQIHRRVKYSIGKINKEINDLVKELKVAEREYKEQLQIIIDDYVTYNGGVYDTGYQTSPNYITLTQNHENNKLTINGQIDVKNDEKTNLNSMIVDLENTADLSLHEAQYINLALLHLTELETRVYDLNSVEDQKQLAEDYNYLNIIAKDNKATGLSEQAKVLKEKLMGDISTYISTLSNEYLNTSGLANPNINIDALLETNDDILFIEKIFTGFGDYPRLEAQLIHALTIDGKQKARLKSVKVGQQITEHLHKLVKWAKANGHTNALGRGSIRKVYSLLVETSNTNRLDLVKPFSRQYYSDVSTKFRELANAPDDATRARVKMWLKDNYYAKVKPSHYANPRYDYIQNHTELKEFYDFFKNTVKEGYSLLPDYVTQKNEEKIPSLMKESFWEFFFLRKQNIMKSIWLASKTLLFGHGHVELYDDKGNPKEQFELEEFNSDTIKIRMTGELEADKKSIDLGMILYEFASFTNDYHEMTSVLPKVRMIQNIVETKEYVAFKPTELKRTVRSGAKSNIYNAIKMYIDSKITGETDKNWLRIPLMGTQLFDNNGDVIGRSNFYMSDFIRQMSKYVRMLYLGMNPFSALSNVSAGIVNDFVEATGGEYFSKRQLGKAMVMYSEQGISAKFRDDNNKTKLALISEYLQPLQEVGEWQDKRKMDMGSPTIGGNIAKSIFDKTFIMQEWGEDFVQKSVMIAYLLNKKSNGKSHWSLFNVVNNQLVFDEVAAGHTYDDVIMQEREIIKKINRELHGNYSKDNSSVYDGQILYQAGMVFKKWLPAMVQARFQAKRYDFSKGKYVEGRFRTVPKVVYKQFHNMFLSMNNNLTAQQNMLNNKKDITKDDIIAVKKTIADITAWMIFVAMSGILMPPPEEKDKDWYQPDWLEDLSIWDSKREFDNSDSWTAMVIKAFITNSNRLAGEAMQMYSLSFYKDIFMRHALIGLVDEARQMTMALWNFMVLPEDSKSLKIRTGINKGETKVLKETRDMIPYVRQADKLMKQGKKTVRDLSK